MPKIKLTNGIYHYRTIPIYEGVKRINKEVAMENLRLLKELLDDYNLEFQITFGTLLGAIREKDFIDHDEDIDLLVLGEKKQAFFDLLPILDSHGFKVARYDRRGLMSIMRNGEYIDLYFLDNKGDGTRYCSGIILPNALTDETINHNFKGLDVKIPKKYVEFLRYEYGDNWETPIQWFDYGSSWLSRFKTAVKMVGKELLPDWLYFKMLKKSERRMLNRYESKLEKYISENKKV